MGLDVLNPMFANAVQKSEHIFAYSVSFVHVPHVGPFPFCRVLSTTISDIIFMNGRRDPQGSCSLLKRKHWALYSAQYCKGSKVLHSLSSAAKVQPHVFAAKSIHFCSSVACSVS